jgi:hypothetical protein
MDNVDLSKPAWGPGSQKITDDQPEMAAPQAEEVKEVAPAPAETSDEAVEEAKVPYSRFRKFWEKAQDAEKEAAYWKGQAEAKRDEPTRTQEDTEVPSYWRELYGESDASQKAWKIQEQANQRLIDEARSQALEAVQSERIQESERVRTNEDIIDQNLESLQDYAGHSLSEREQSAILDIVDEYTPKDEDGNYLGATIPFDKAWDIYELQQAASKAPRSQSRDKVAALTGTPSNGESQSEKEQRDKDFNPLDWGAALRRLGK